jgi:hypothetical protein
VPVGAFVEHLLLLLLLAVLRQAFNVSECLCEIFDNSIRAGADSISVTSSQNAQGSVATIRFGDNGVRSGSSSSSRLSKLWRRIGYMITAQVANATDTCALRQIT